MSSSRINQLVVMVSLCSSIVEGIEHLLAHQENYRLKDDAVAALKTLENNLKGFDVDTALLYETRWIRELLRGNLFVYDREFKNKLYRWYCLILKELRNLMVAETEKCPICRGKGTPFYGAVLYQPDTEQETDSVEAVRILMRCQDCGNYYLAKEEAEETLDGQGTRRTKARCEKLLELIKEFAPEGTMLFIGDEKGQLYKEAQKTGYDLTYISPENIGTELVKREKGYEVVLVERILKKQDRKEMIKALSGYLSEEGILWFDGPDIEKHFKSLEKKGSPLWKEELEEICLSEEGLSAFLEECGLSIKCFHHVGRVTGRIEVIAEKKKSRKEGMVYGTSDNA